MQQDPTCIRDTLISYLCFLTSFFFPFHSDDSKKWSLSKQKFIPWKTVSKQPSAFRWLTFSFYNLCRQSDIQLIPSTLCVPGLRRGRTVTAHWLSQGRTKREAETMTQVRYLINLTLILVLLTLTLPHWTEVNSVAAFGHCFNCFCC